MDAFTVNQQIEEKGYIIISDMDDAELAELFAIMEDQEVAQ